MPDRRPNPDELLAQVKADEAQAKRGTLRIYFGYAAGVGKTYAMLEDARAAKRAGREVVVGYVEPHDRPETLALLDSLEAIPPAKYSYRGVELRELDIDAALARRPALMLVDELAHTNADPCRHAKRWQDVEELLNAGIHVWTTLNVQHLESLNDVIGQVTGVVVRETIPDRIFEQAGELELVDISPDELLARLASGKVYVPDQAKRAIQSFFQKGNLHALRELSLRQAARRIHSDVEQERKQRAVLQPWATGERLLVCVGPSPTTARVIRTAKRMALALDAPWTAVCVETPGEAMRGAAKEQIAENFRLAEQLGAETVTISGEHVAATILEYARSRNVTKICIGKTSQPLWRRLIVGTVVDAIIDGSGPIDVYVIHGEEEQGKAANSPATSDPPDWLGYLGALSMIAATGGVAAGLKRLQLADAEANTVMLFLAAVACVAYWFGTGPAILGSVAAVLVFDFFFVEPRLDFAVSDAQYVVTFAVMLAIGILISTITSRLKAQLESGKRRERRISSLQEMGKQLSSLSGEVFLVSAAGAKVAELTGGEVAIYLRQFSGPPHLAYGLKGEITGHPLSLPVAQWVIDHNERAGAGTNTLPNALALFFPLTGSQQTLGALAIRAADMPRLLEPDERRMLEACANQLALALERDQLAIEAAEARIEAEAEQVRSALLSSVSHDLKTPLAAIAGASSSLLAVNSIDDATRRQLLETVADEALRLNRLLENILQMSKLDAGAAAPNKEWHVLEELVGSALHRVRGELSAHPVDVRISPQLPLLLVDGLLLEQLLVNLLENAARYTSAGTPIQIVGAPEGNSLRLSITDHGPGIPAGMEERIFEKFYRANPAADAGRGSGLGLAICRAIAKTHGGNITAANRPGGGAEFVVRLPLQKDSPQVVVE